MKTMLVARKVVEFEDGRLVEVDPFEISLRPVTIDDFEAFAAASGYVTTAERAGSPDTFNANQELTNRDKPRPNDMAQIPASYTSHDDATSYRHWRNARLPTEVEWLAFSVVTDQQFPRGKGLENATFREFMKRVGQVCFCGYEWTATAEGLGFVARSEPRGVRYFDWRDDIQRNRRVFQPDYFAPVTGFRVVTSPL